MPHMGPQICASLSAVTRSPESFACLSVKSESNKPWIVDFWLGSVKSDMSVADETNTNGSKMMNEPVMTMNEYIIHCSLMHFLIHELQGKIQLKFCSQTTA